MDRLAWFRTAMCVPFLSLRWDDELMARWSQVIYINAIKNTIDMRVSDEELARRRKDWAPREPKVKSVRSVPSGLRREPLLMFFGCAGNAVQVLQARRGCFSWCDHGQLPVIDYCSAGLWFLVLVVYSGPGELFCRPRGTFLAWESCSSVSAALSFQPTLLYPVLHVPTLFSTPSIHPNSSQAVLNSTQVVVSVQATPSRLSLPHLVARLLHLLSQPLRLSNGSHHQRPRREALYSPRSHHHWLWACR